jgi:ADP-ribose pyrophosphatase
MIDPHSDADIEILSRRQAYRGFARIDLLELRHRLHSGAWGPRIERELYDRGHVAAVLPYDPAADRIVLLRQFRIGAHAAGFPAWQTEAVAGMIGAGETAEEVARREAREEAGLVVTDLEPVAHYLSSPGASSESVMLFCGRTDASRAGGIHGLAGEHEDIAVTTHATRDIPDLLVDPAASNGLTLIGLQWLLIHRERLRRQWTIGGAT